MISIKMIIAIMAILAISHSCMAQEGPGFGRPPGGPRRPGGPPEGSEGPGSPHDGTRGPGGRPRSPSSSSSEGSGDDTENNNQRLFFSTLFSTQRVSCDYSTQAGTSCLNCQQRLVCTRRGGFLTTCRGLLRHCTDGRCSFRQSDACAAGTATTTAAATTTQAATTTAQPTTTMAG